MKLYTTLCPPNNATCNRNLTLVSSYKKPDFDGHNLRTKFITFDSSIEVYVDETLVYKSAGGQNAPTSIWMGTPEYTNSNDAWSTLEILGINATQNDVVIPIKKIILVPGFGASWNYHSIFTNTDGGEWVIPSWINTYDNLVNSLQNVGYKKDSDLFIYGYDWRKDLGQQADSLNTYIQNLVTSGKISSDTKINFVAHSFGGLVTRAYLDKYGNGHLGKLVTAGSPHQGAALSYKTWSGGQILLGNWWQKSALSLLVGLNTIKGESPVSAVRRMSPSIKNILPTYDYLVDVNSNALPVSSMSQINQYLLDLNSDISNINASTSAITGDTFNTVEKLQYESRDWLDGLLGKWQDGRPIEDTVTIHGDGTVTRDSAKALFSNYLVTELDHGDLVFDSAGIAAIFQNLDLDVSKIVATASATEGNNPIVAILRSPGDLKLKSPSGVLVGMGESATASAVVIPEQKLIIVPNPEIGDYEVQVVTDGTTGDYSLFAGYSNSEGLDLKRIDATLTTSDTDRFLLNKVSNLQTLETTNDPDFVEVILEITNRLDPSLETLIQNKNRLNNLKTFLAGNYTNYEDSTEIIQRNTNLEILRQLNQIDKNTVLVEKNSILLSNLINFILAENSKKIPNESVSTSLYDSLYAKIASSEAKIQHQIVSTSSAILLNDLLSMDTPWATQSTNLNLDLSKLFLKSIFLH
jgi:pimeloyl-ACP methyl ester carboxylesterase